MQDNRGTLCSCLVLTVFALHLKNIEESSDDEALDFGHTHGALGLAAASVCLIFFVTLYSGLLSFCYLNAHSRMAFGRWSVH